MISFNDTLECGTVYQGALRVIATAPGKSAIVYDGEGEDVPSDETWGEGYVTFIYYDALEECLTVEIEQEEV